MAPMKSCLDKVSRIAISMIKPMTKKAVSKKSKNDFAFILTKHL